MLHSTTMKFPLFKNFIGFELPDEQMRDIPYPYVEMHAHVIMKCAQAFGFLGTVVVGPLVALSRSETRTLSGIQSSACTYGKYGVLLSFVAGPLMTSHALSIKNADRGGVYDRCYQLRYNKKQLRIDRGSAVGAVTGTALAGHLDANPVMGALVGMSMGFVSMIVYNYALPKK